MEHPEVTELRLIVNHAQVKDRWDELCQSADVSLSWLQKFARGEITNPTVNTLHSVRAAGERILFNRQVA